MAGNWMDDRERMMRERDGRELGDGRRAGGGEDRSWARDDGPGRARRSGPDRDRVFGERESGVSYGRATSSGYRGGSASRGWQDPNYGGVSPAMRHDAKGAGDRFTSQDYTGGGRFYGDDNRERVYREEYGQGGVEYSDLPKGYDAGGYSPTPDRYPAEGYGQPGFGGSFGEPRPGEYRRDPGKPPSGGTGGYDYERGYGDAGRRDSRGERFQDAGRGAGEFLHRTGEKVAAWFGSGGEPRAHDPDLGGRPRGARGLGPQGYKRSDERISDDVHDRLTEDALLDASNISVAVSGGEVTLSGQVKSREAKHHAEHLVEDLSGVTHVQNNLRLTGEARAEAGDSVLGAQLRTTDDAVANGTGGAGGGQSTAGKKD